MRNPPCRLVHALAQWGEAKGIVWDVDGGEGRLPLIFVAAVLKDGGAMQAALHSEYTGPTCVCACVRGGHGRGLLG
jgi:hypothetical protein